MKAAATSEEGVAGAVVTAASVVGAAAVVATVVDVSAGAVVAAAGTVVGVLATKVVVGERVSSDDVVVSVEHDAPTTATGRTTACSVASPPP